ncbi:EamA family transporter [Microvirga tunisiensis]|uniref:EamA family transporter n=2 Tax=Pannonibacter tanglangensis TaxID=2750084 RepID=A0ABW9ZN81_9HYPH|nr:MULTISPECIES: EamA family transporter [unclassified Pannonibacter]NBN65031.1 EamA family transporter [Pannonibacter sp. XCT-34]NBN79540.1 EamA family transporter [Pannonibacter sp. XCT-53]
MLRLSLLATAVAPLIWGSSYIVITEFLPPDRPMTLAMWRALPAALLLLLIVRQLPRGKWIWRVTVLGALNFTLFWTLMNIGAYRLPGGVAATVGAVQPLIVLALSRLLIGTPLTAVAAVAAMTGLFGVGLLTLRPEAALDGPGILAALGGAVSMAFGTVLTRYWKPDVSAVTFTAWQLTAGGLLLVPLALLSEPALPPLTLTNWVAFAYFSFIGAGLTYLLWFRGIALMGPTAVAPIALLSPAMAVVLGWVWLDQGLSFWQLVGMGLVLVSVLAGQWAGMAAERTRQADAAAAATAATPDDAAAASPVHGGDLRPQGSA